MRGTKACEKGVGLWRLRTAIRGGPVFGKERDLCCGTMSVYFGGGVGGGRLTNLAGWHLDCVWGLPGGGTCLQCLKSFIDRSFSCSQVEMSLLTHLLRSLGFQRLL